MHSIPLDTALLPFHNREVLSFLRGYGRLMIPPFWGAPLKGLVLEIYGRIIVLTWMHFIGGLTYSVIFCVIIFFYPNSSELQSSLLSLPVASKCFHPSPCHAVADAQTS